MTDRAPYHAPYTDPDIQLQDANAKIAALRAALREAIEELDTWSWAENMEGFNCPRWNALLED